MHRVEPRDRQPYTQLALLAIRTAACLLLLASAGCSDDAQPNLVIVSFDTVRRDHVSTYGYPRPTTPTLDRLGGEGLVFDHAFAQFTSTVASHASMFTGLYPHVHGNDFGRELAPQHLTLAEILRDAEFRTGAFVSGFTLRGQAAALGRGFEIYDDAFDGARRGGSETLARALDWLKTVPPGERFFLFVHFYDAHGPYLPNPEFSQGLRATERGRFLAWIPPYQRQTDEYGRPIEFLNDFVERYDAQIRFQDYLLSVLVAEAGGDDTIVVVLSDHGETLGERMEPLSLDHGKAVFEELTQIPLVIRGPGIEPARVGSPAETIDLLPTLLPLLGVDLPVELDVQGEDLRRLLGEDGPTRARHFVFSSCQSLPAYYEGRGYRLREPALIHSVRGRRWKLIRYPGIEADYLELYDLNADPGELLNVAATHPEDRARLELELDRWLVVGGEAPMAPLPREEDREALRALGYVE